MLTADCEDQKQIKTLLVGLLMSRDIKEAVSKLEINDARTFRDVLHQVKLVSQLDLCVLLILKN
jgi:hypothetical protein